MRRGQQAFDRAGALEGSPMLHAPGNVCSVAGGLQGSAPRRGYDEAYGEFLRIAALADVDTQVRSDPTLTRGFEAALEAALEETYSHAQSSATAAHLFLQRVLYRINRLKLFWYDDLENYDNERSGYLRSIRERIEAPWQRWELAKLDLGVLRREETSAALRMRAATDVDPPISETGRFFRDEVAEPGYRRLLEIASLDGLVEASQLSRTLGGVGNDVHAVLTRLFLEEYGCGRLARKHSSYFAVMLSELGMVTEPEGYFEQVPWQVLAAINHSFLLSERKRYFLRYIGGLLYTEISVPAAFSAYRSAAQRLGFGDSAMAYWDLHIKEDERHGRWMLNDIALPLAQRYPKHAWELVLGYEQQRAFGERAGAAVASAARDADRAALSQPGRSVGVLA
jgi:hypothetical protein